MTALRESFRRDFEHWVHEFKRTTVEDHLYVSSVFIRPKSECVLEGVTFLVEYDASLKGLYFTFKDGEKLFKQPLPLFFQEAYLSKGILATIDLLELQTKLDNFAVKKIIEE